MKILTFNRHESFLCSLAATGHDFDVVVERHGSDLQPWAPHARPAPPNLRFVAFDRSVRERLAAGVYDATIVHTVRDLTPLFPYRRTRYVFCAHIPLLFHSPQQVAKAAAKRVVLLAFAATHDLQFVAVSAYKKKTWRLGAGLVPLTPEPMRPRHCDDREVGALVVCNDLLARREELGASTIAAVGRLAPLTIVGQRNVVRAPGTGGGRINQIRNPGETRAIEPPTHTIFMETVRRFGIYLYTVRRPWGDGYNLALLEAMSMGMAVVTVVNPSSPVVHGVNGLVGQSPAELAAHIRRLMVDDELRERLGSAARQTVAQSFSQRAFVEAWNRCLNPIEQKGLWLAPAFLQSH